MKLVSATVRNYRIHRETRVDFDPSLTLIGGPNESGKSTFIEAVHRGLFLKSRITGEGRQGMVSSLYPGHPEVEIVFSAGGTEYRLQKRFSGAGGTTTLSEAGGASRQGDEAEALLNALLQVEDVGGGRNLADRILQQWAHLWVWQGKSGHDPSGDTASEQNALLGRLQREGGAVALQSPRDAEVAGRFAERSAALFTQAGRPKAGSELQQAESRLQAAQVARQDAALRQQRLVDAASGFEQAEETIRRTTADLESLAAGLRKVEEQLASAQRLKTREEQQALASARTEERLSDLRKADGQIDMLRREIRALEAALAPGREETERARTRREERRAQAQLAAEAHEEAAGEARLLRQRCELARAWVERFDCDARCRELARRQQDAQKIRDSIRSLRDELAPLPRVDADSLGRLRELQARADRAAAALEAMAAGIEVVSSGRPVRIGDREAPAGSAHRVTDAVDIFIGDDVHLRVRPGGGNSLAEARDSLRTAGDALREALDPLGVDSVARAAGILNVRESLQSKLEREQSRLGDFDDGSLEGDLAEAREALAAAEGEVDRRSQRVPGTREPLDRNRAVAWRQGEERALERTEEEETVKKAAGQAAGEAFDAAEHSLLRLAAAIGAQETHLGELEAQLRLLLTNHGEDDVRLKALRTTEEAAAAARAALEQTRAQLADLQPEQLERDRSRLARAIQTQEEQRQKAREQRAASRAALTLDGSEDPLAELTRANVRERAARDYYESVRRRAEAVRLLGRLFEEERRVLADRFTRPLAERISDYLKGVLGPGARAEVTFDGGVFKGIHLVRPGTMEALAFDALSGGTREQLAAAVRLATAELLAADHGGSLPVVFDDSFAFSDPDRVRDLQRMLDLAAARGLQIIVLTCNPSDYAPLGARQTLLSPAPVESVKPAGPEVEETEPAGLPAEAAAAEEAPSAAETTEADCDAFMAALRGLGGKSGNQALCANLGWTGERYAAARTRLLGQGRILPGKGRGGSVTLPA
ncbi:MAG: AAA family ATPase [Acidobacteria bacterium]|nr:AAA family ATPase [Acidobacteriota bacterium]